MDGSIRLSAKERKACLKLYRSAREARRALVLLLLDGECFYRQIVTAALASPTLIAAVKRDFQSGGLARVLHGEGRETSVAYWVIVVMRWLVSFTPQDFGFFRSRCSCELLALLLRECEGIRLSPETVRRGMHRMEFVWRRPRPVVGPRDPEHAPKLRQIQRLIAQLPSDETVVFQDEVDVHLNPKIGPCWMVRGETGRGRHARQQREAPPGRLAALEDGPTAAIGSRATSERCAVHRPLGRAVIAAPRLSSDPRCV
jgi:putative transposase